MTLRDGFDRTVSAWLDEEAGRGAPDYLDEVLARTTRTRQRPAWSSPERWLPVQTTLTLVPVRRVGWLLVTLAALAILVVFAAVVGSRPRLPEPFGPARNGTLVYATVGGDIFALDPTTGRSRLIIGGPGDDIAPTFSRDGTKFVFGRRDGTAERWVVTVADADGTNLVALTEPLEVTSWAWSPDGSQLAVAVKSATSFKLVNLDGSPTTDVDLGMSAEFLQWRPGGRELVFRGVTGGPGGPTYGLYVVRVDGSDLRPIKSPTDSGEHWQNPALSPDGERLIYTTWDPGGGNLYAVAIDSGEVQQLVFDAGPDSDYYAQWSPDGSRVVFNRGRAQETYRLAVGPATGGQAVDIGPVLAWDAAADAVFSPDGSKVIARYGDGSTWLFDVTSGQGEQVLSASALFVATWQRLAP